MRRPRIQQVLRALEKVVAEFEGPSELPDEPAPQLNPLGGGDDLKGRRMEGVRRQVGVVTEERMKSLHKRASEAYMAYSDAVAYAVAAYAYYRAVNAEVLDALAARSCECSDFGRASNGHERALGAARAAAAALVPWPRGLAKTPPAPAGVAHG